MADISNEKLRRMADGKYAYSRVVQILAAKLLAARARIAKLEQEPPMALIDFGYGLDLQGIRDDLQFLDDVRRENRQLRADLREAMELLRAHGQAPQWMRSAGRFDAVEDWNRRYGKLLEKHKETNQ